MGYKAGGKNYQVSFCGYFPSDRPKYSAIVVIRDPVVGYASGGVMAGGVFKEIAEQIYARELWIDLNSKRVKETKETGPPKIKTGLPGPSFYVMDKLNIKYDDSGVHGGRPIVARREEESKRLLLEERNLIENLVPNVLGMGARDAILLLEQWGLQVRLTGKGKVVQQSLRPGTVSHEGQEIVLRLN
jgi:cell division protein FtsI (penicillin-binding protein 3)